VLLHYLAKRGNKKITVMSSDISHRIPLTGEGRSLAGKISG